jgi:hypothetical protein
VAKVAKATKKVNNFHLGRNFPCFQCTKLYNIAFIFSRIPFQGTHLRSRTNDSPLLLERSRWTISFLSRKVDRIQSWEAMGCFLRATHGFVWARTLGSNSRRSERTRAGIQRTQTGCRGQRRNPAYVGECIAWRLTFSPLQEIIHIHFPIKVNLPFRQLIVIAEVEIV